MYLLSKFNNYEHMVNLTTFLYIFTLVGLFFPVFLWSAPTLSPVAFNILPWFLCTKLTMFLNYFKFTVSRNQFVCFCFLRRYSYFMVNIWMGVWVFLYVLTTKYFWFGPTWILSRGKTGETGLTDIGNVTKNSTFFKFSEGWNWQF